MSEAFAWEVAGVLIVLIALSGYFSGSETAMMALNRYRLRHLAEQKHKGARRALKLLEQPDRFIGFILLGNNFVNILLTQIATLVILQLFGDGNLLVATVCLTLIIVIFGEVLPKTVAALNPERIAFPSTVLLAPLMTLFHPLVFALNWACRVLLSLLRIDSTRAALDTLDREELRTVVKEAGALIPQKHRDMLFGILDLDKVTVEDIMVPRAEIVAIDLDKGWIEVVEQIVTCRHTRVPCYRGSIDNIAGFLHMRNIARLLRQGHELRLEDIEAILSEPYFVPLKADLHTQLINFQLAKRRMALVVDEYGEIEGLVTIDDLLGQIVGAFTSLPQFNTRDVYQQQDGSYLIDGSANIRELNRAFGWRLPEGGPKTLNGVILEALEDIPEPGTSLRIGDYTIEIVQSTGQAVRNARIFPPAPAGQDQPQGPAGTDDNGGHEHRET